MNNLKKKATLSILLMVSMGHLLNDMFQSVIPSIYPIIKESLGLSFMQIGAITLTNQITASLLQPMVGYFSDRHPRPYGLVVGMCFTLTGLLLLSVASSFLLVLLSVAFVGIGSSVLHPESSKIARMASGGAKGMAQSIFQIGGNVGMISGAFFGLSFGLGGIGSALFGWIADLTSIQYVFQLTAFLPLLGIAAYFLPNIKE